MRTLTILVISFISLVVSCLAHAQQTMQQRMQDCVDRAQAETQIGEERNLRIKACLNASSPENAITRQSPATPSKAEAPQAIVSGAGGKLTDSLAQQAIARAGYGGASPKVLGVMEFPQQSMAKADFHVSNFVYNLPRNDPVTAYAFGPGGGQRSFTGNMEAHFKRYNDGRWVLVKIVGPMGEFTANVTIKP